MGKRLAVTAETPLERSVLRWINGQAAEYDTGAAGVLRDLFRGGCQSGIVGHLIYYSDTVRFYKRHRAEISAMFSEYIEETGCSPESLRGWDRSDPFAQTVGNQNILAWYGFEETARKLADRAGIEV